MIDRLREQIEQRLDQLLGEADRLRKALAALDPRPSKRRRASLPHARARGRRSPGVLADERAPARRTSAPASRLPSPDGARRDEGRRARGARRRRADDRRRGRGQGRAGPPDRVDDAHASSPRPARCRRPSAATGARPPRPRHRPRPRGSQPAARRWTADAPPTYASRRWQRRSFTSSLQAARISDNMSESANRAGSRAAPRTSRSAGRSGAAGSGAGSGVARPRLRRLLMPASANPVRALRRARPAPQLLDERLDVRERIRGELS